MVRKSIRVVLVAENDLIEVASDPDNFRFVTEVGQGGSPLYRITGKIIVSFTRCPVALANLKMWLTCKHLFMYIIDLFL